jgi:hypothetical protein
VAVIVVDREVEALYRVPLGDFVAARKALAARLKAAGRREEAAMVTSLPKPAATAWALNQVYWFDRQLFDALAAAGQRLLEAQREALAGRPADVAGPARARQAAVDAVVDRAAGFLAAAGGVAGIDTRRRLAVSADALAARGSAIDATGPAPGRLAADLDPTGFSVLAALTGTPGPQRPAVEPPPSGGPAGRDDGATPPGRGASSRRAAPPAVPPPRDDAPPPHPTRRAAIEQVMRAAAAAEATLERAVAAAGEARAQAAAAQQRRRTAEEARDAARAAHDEARRQLERARAAVGPAEQALADADATAAALERAAGVAEAARARAVAALADARARLDRLWSELP